MRSKLLIAVAAVCLAAAGGSVAEGFRSGSEHRYLRPASVVNSVRVSVPATADPRRSKNPAPIPPRSSARPTVVSIPAVGLTARIVPVGLTGTGAIAVPNPSVAGWYRLDPTPGDDGPVVLVGHVDTIDGPAVFYRLTAVHVGDAVLVIRADGSRAHFIISRVTVVKKTAFPGRAVFAPTSGADIRLITCTGQFDPSSHHYVDSLIAWGVAAA